MVPIYDSDLAEKRWSMAEWNHYELWERVENRFHRQKKRWVTGTVIIFLILSAVPVILQQKLKWQSLAASRQLAQEINQMKRLVAIHQAPYRIQFQGGGSLTYQIEKLTSCADLKGTLIRSASLISEPGVKSFSLLSPEKGEEFLVPGVVEGFCYDPYLGNIALNHGTSLVGFGILPVKDLAEGNLERLSILILSGESAEISFD